MVFPVTHRVVLLVLKDKFSLYVGKVAFDVLKQLLGAAHHRIAQLLISDGLNHFHAVLYLLL